jgi:hypothetical protein
VREYRAQIDALAQVLLADGVITQSDVTKMLRPRTMPVSAVVAEVVGAMSALVRKADVGGVAGHVR